MALNVAVLAILGTRSIMPAGLLDMLVMADQASALSNERSEPLFDVRLIGLDPHDIDCGSGIRLTPAAIASEIETPDLVVVPALNGDDLDASFALNKAWVPWLSLWHEHGAKVASSCTGAFLLAEAGILNGKPATTHWMFAPELATRCPTATVQMERVIVDCGDVITAAGATTFLNLVLYLVRRFGGPERATMAAKVLLIDGQRSSQLPYVAFWPERSHDDQVVHRVQQYVDGKLDEPLRVDELAAQFGVSPRTMTRRFVAATGLSPAAYLATARLHHAQRLLETTSDPVDSIRRQVGYEDPAAFRRAFKEMVGLSPSGYRNAYGLTGVARSQSA